MTGADGQIANVRCNVINTLGGNLAVGKRQEVMVESLWMSFADNLSRTLEVANHLLLLGVNAKYRNTLVKSLLRKGVYLTKLRIPVLVLLQRLGLDKGAFLETTRSHHLTDMIVRNVYTALFEYLSNLRCGQADPLDGIVLWEPGRISLYNVVEHFKQDRLLV